MNIGFALCGSFCTYAQIFPMLELLSRDYCITPIFSQSASSIDSRFGCAREHMEAAGEICGNKPLCTIEDVEPVGPKKLFDALIIAPCTGNTLAKLAAGIADTSVTLAAKAHLRNSRPLIIAVSTNDGLGANARNIGQLMARQNVYFVPFGQDDAFGKPDSLVAHFERIDDTLQCAMKGEQIQPLLT